MNKQQELTTAIAETPVFYEALAEAANLTREMAKSNYDKISHLTDLHRVEVFLERAEAA